VTAAQQEALPLWDVDWYATRTGAGAPVEVLRLERDGTFAWKYLQQDTGGPSDIRVVSEQGRFTVTDDTLSFWSGDALTARVRVERVKPDIFALRIILPSATQSGLAASEVVYKRVARKR
jgi:hypothetical protein